MRRDLQYAAQMLARSPGSTAAIVLVLALGIGANTAIFTLVNAFMLRPLPGIEQPERLVQVRQFRDGRGFGAMSHPAYRYYRDHNQVFSGLAAYRFTELDLGGGEPVRVSSAAVSSDYFAVLGARVARGRTFLPEENETPDAHPVAVISHGLWERRFGADAGLVGRTITLNGHAFAVIGIAARGFHGTEAGGACDVWVPLAMHGRAMPGVLASLDAWDFNWLEVIGRLRPGVSLDQARAEMSLLARQLALAYPKQHKGIRAAVERKYGFALDGFVATLMAVVGVLLVIACANAANLLLARASTRQREIAIRLALGASRARLVRQLLTESILISLIAGVFGLLLAWWTADLMLPLLGEADRPPVVDLAPDPRVLAFTLLLSTLTGVVFGLAPALQASKPDLVTALKEGAGRQASGRSRLRGLLVICQVALSLVLLISAGLLVRALRSFGMAERGLRTANVLLASVQPGLHRGYDRARRNAFYRQLQERVAALPGVESASLARDVLIGSFFKEQVAAEGREPPPGAPWPEFGYNVIAPGYLNTMGVPLVRGRDFSFRDTDGAPKVVLLNESIARRLWAAEDPVGKRLRIKGEGSPREVIGVAKDVEHAALWKGVQPNLYYPLLQEHPWERSAVIVHIRTAARPSALAAAVRREVRSLDPNLPVFGVETLEEYIGHALWDLRTMNTVTGAAGLLALLVASIGLYGVVSYTAAQRTQEIGIRLALGAERTDVLKLVVREGMVLTLAGVAIGLAGAFAATRVLSSFLYRVSATDPLTFAGIALVLGGVALAASYIPARRAARVDPLLALRYE